MRERNVEDGLLRLVPTYWTMYLARRWHTFGGRRIESPQGGDTAGQPLREHLAHRCQDTEAQAFEADVLRLGKISVIFRPRTSQ